MPPSASTLLHRLRRRLPAFSEPPPGGGSRVFRRIVFLGMGAVLLSVTGLSWLVLHWRGDRGRPPAGRLYLLGDFPGSAPVLRLRPAPGPKGPREGACFTVESRLAPARAAKQRVCSGGRTVVWVGDARVEVMVNGAGLPAVSLAGARFRDKDWIGSGAGGPAAPRFPLRGYGTPSRAAQVVSCPASVRGPAACIEVHDRLGRLAVGRRDGAAQGDPRLAPGGPRPLYPGDELWLGLVAYTVGVQQDGGRSVLELERRLAGTAGSAGSLVGHGGDRRWLGRLWPIEPPDPAAPAATSYDVYPMRERFSPGNLSTRRTNFEIEDRVQRLVDGEWLCLEMEDGVPRIRWRPLDAPGCGASGGRAATAHTQEEEDDYRLGRYGGGGLVPRLVEAAGAGLALREFLEAPSALPLAFDWVLRADTAAGPQPWPTALWGVRFGAVQLGRGGSGGGSAGSAPPVVALRASTARDRVELLENGLRRATFYLPVADSGGASRPGAVCLATGGDLLAGGDGTHHPLGTVFLGGGAQNVRWSPNAGLPCGGCRLEVQGAGGGLRFTPAGCRDTAPVTLAEGAEYPLPGGLSLRYTPRSAPAWVAMTDPATGRRHLAREFVDEGGMAPLLGQAGGSHGIEAAVHGMADTASAEGRALELTIDGDLQLQAAEIVRQAIADAGSNRPGEGRLSAVVLDARTGEVLAATSTRRSARPAPGRPTAWDAATGHAGADNDAFLRDRPIGSTMKVVGAYVLANNGFAGPSLPPPGTDAPEAVLKDGGHGLTLARAFASRHPKRATEAPRQCSAGGGAHTVPVDDRAFTDSLFVDRFGRSCNTFFIVNGFRHASAPAAQVAGTPGANTVALSVDASRGLTLRVPQRAPLASRLRAGLLDDAARGDSSAPLSIYGALVRLGFQPHPGRGWRGEAAGWMEVEEGGTRGRVGLDRSWFAAAGGGPSLRPGEDFLYPTLPSPGRLGDADSTARPMEWYDGTPVRVVRDERADGDWPDAQYAMLMIGQSAITSSALSVAALYGPAARADGRAVAPCLFRVWCRDPRESPVVLNPNGRGAAVFNQALLRVVQAGTATTVLSAQGFPMDGGWGGKSGTYNLDVKVWPAGLGSAEEWDALAAFACGVQGAAFPTALPGRLTGTYAVLADPVRRLHAAGAGAAAGATACENRKLHPGGIHHYGAGPLRALLDEVDGRVSEFAGEKKRLATYHAMVLVALPQRGGLPRARSAAEGIVVAVIEDDELDIAKIIAGRLASAAERWAAVRR